MSAEMLTMKEVARFLRVSKSTVLRLRKRGQLVASLVSGRPRFRREEIERFLTRNAERRR